MMYAVPHDLYSRFGKKNIDFLVQNKIDSDDVLLTADDVLNSALRDASVMIDGYIGNRVTLPVKKVPEVLIRTACILAYYQLADSCATEKSTKDYDDALRYLEKIAQGQISLGLTAQSEPLSESNEVAIITSSGSVWNRKRSRGFI